MAPSETPFAEACIKCDGLCCKGPIFVSLCDIARLRAAGIAATIKSDGAFRTLALRQGRCQFLERDGCALPRSVRPLDCRVFPVVFVADSTTRFFLSEKCPFLSSIPSSWVDTQRAVVLDEISQWATEDVSAYSGHIRAALAQGLLRPLK